MPTLDLNRTELKALRFALTRSAWVPGHDEALTKVLSALSDDPEALCRRCCKPRREHAYGYSASRCGFSA